MKKILLPVLIGLCGFAALSASPSSMPVVSSATGEVYTHDDGFFQVEVDIRSSWPSNTLAFTVPVGKKIFFEDAEGVTAGGSANDRCSASLIRARNGEQIGLATHTSSREGGYSVVLLPGDQVLVNVPYGPGGSSYAYPFVRITGRWVND